jgi:hypothetical protein
LIRHRAISLSAVRDVASGQRPADARARGLRGVYALAVRGLRPPSWPGGLLGFVRLRATRRGRRRQLINARNEGVPGSSPGVGFAGCRVVSAVAVSYAQTTRNTVCKREESIETADTHLVRLRCPGCGHARSGHCISRPDDKAPERACLRGRLPGNGTLRRGRCRGPRFRPRTAADRHPSPGRSGKPGSRRVHRDRSRGAELHRVPPVRPARVSVRQQEVVRGRDAPAPVFSTLLRGQVLH